MPLFSFIIPVYNAATYLNKCIDSILVQTVHDFEVVLVNDGSTDESPIICDNYQHMDSRVRVIHKSNEGISLARQTGVDSANGEYLVFVDSDDWVEKDYLVEISKYTGVDVIRFGNRIVASDGSIADNLPVEREGLYNKDQIENTIFPYLIQDEKAGYYCPSLWCHAIKRSLFSKHMIRDTVIKMGEDGACIIPCIYHAESIYVVHKSLYNYNYNCTSATKSGKVFDWYGPEKIASHLRNQIDILKFDFQDQLNRKVVHELFSVIVSQFNRNETYRVIKNDIEMHIDNTELYITAIEKAHYKDSIIAILMHKAIRHRWYRLISIYAAIKRIV